MRPIIFLLLAFWVYPNSAKLGGLVHVNDNNWEQILEGEWMVEFFAPWCPACRSLETVWREFAGWSKDLGIGVGQVDITQSAGLSGRFMITALPTIYHVKEGVFRQYRGPRTKEDFLTFVEDKKWQEVSPLSSWQAPSSVQMSVVSQFYRISMGLRNVMNVLLDDYGIPSWAAYIIFGLVTILIGLILGLVLVCVIDCIYPQGGKKDTNENDFPETQDGEEEDMVAEGSEVEEEPEPKAEKKVAPSTPEPAETRRRRARKAD